MTTTLSRRETLEKLLERVKAASGPDENLDYGIWFVLAEDIGDVPKLTYTASIDAALALVERALPGWRWHMSSPRMGLACEAVLHQEWNVGNQRSLAYAATPCLAVLAALLTALIAQETKE